MGFPVQTISKFLTLGFGGFRCRFRPEARHHARKKVQHWWPHPVWLKDTGQIFPAQMIPAHSGGGILDLFVVDNPSGNARLQSDGGTDPHRSSRQFVAVRKNARRRVPPGRELMTAEAVERIKCFERELDLGENKVLQASHRLNSRAGPMGADVSPVRASISSSMLPGVRSASLMNKPAVNHDVAHGVLEQRSSDIYSFREGTRTGIPGNREGDTGGRLSRWNTRMMRATMLQSPAMGRGAVLEAFERRSRNLFSAAERMLPFQTRTPFPSASVAALSMAELCMNLRTLHSLMPDFQKLSTGDPGTGVRRLQP